MEQNSALEKDSHSPIIQKLDPPEEELVKGDGFKQGSVWERWKNNDEPHECRQGERYKVSKYNVKQSLK